MEQEQIRQLHEEALQDFEQYLPLLLLHSGTPLGGIWVETVQGWFEWDEDDCNEAWANYLDACGIVQEYSIAELL